MKLAVCSSKGGVGKTTSLVGVFGGLIGSLVANILDTGSFAQLLLQIAGAVLLVLVLRPSRGTTGGTPT